MSVEPLLKPAEWAVLYPTPEPFHHRKRIEEIQAAISRYSHAGFIEPAWWRQEIQRITALLYPTEQTAPVANGSTPIWELVITDMATRDKTGRERYGTPLQAGNGRNSLQDAYEEALDLVVYLRTRIEEDRIAESKALSERDRAAQCARLVAVKYMKQRMPEHAFVAEEVNRLIMSAFDPNSGQEI